MADKPILPWSYLEALFATLIFVALGIATATGAAFVIYVRQESAYDIKVAQQTGDILVRLDRLERKRGCGDAPDER